MDSINAIIAQGSALISKRDSATSALSPSTFYLLIVLLSLVLVGLFAAVALYTIHRVKKSRKVKNNLPHYNEAKNTSHLTIHTTPYNGRSSSIYVYDEKTSIVNNASSPPMSPNSVPEIRITFPDEHDESGRPKSGRVVVVRVAEHGYGLEPLTEEQLPAYEKETGGRFQSIDMDRIGGLREKSSWS